MIFDECKFGDYRIFAGAIEGPQGDGYLAAVAVSRARAGPASHDEVFRDSALCCGHRWSSAAEALTFAMRKGVEAAMAAGQARHRSTEVE